MRATRLAVCAVLVAPLPIAFVNSLRRETAEPVVLPPLLGGKLAPEPMPHARVLGLVSRPAVAPRRRAHRVAVARDVVHSHRARPILVTYVVPTTRHTAPVVLTRPAHRSHAVAPHTTKPKPKPTPKPEPAPTPTPKPAPEPTPPATPPATTPTGGGGSVPAATPPATPPATTTTTSVPPPAPSVPAEPSTPATPSTPSTPAEPAAAPAESTRPGNGYGDKNHVHTGPPGKNK